MDQDSERIVLRPLVEADAPALAECFERCYGRSYVVGEFYDPAATAARVRDRTLQSIVAVNETNEIVGHMGLTIRDPRARTADAGNSIVDPRYRGRQLVARLAVSVIELCRVAGFLGFHHYPTTVHPIMQRLAVAGAGIETGILLAYIPSGTEYREIDGAPRSDRPAVVVVYHPVRAAPAREVFVPAHVASLVGRAYERAGAMLPRTLVTAAASLRAAESSVVAKHDARRGLLRVTVERIGGDLPERVTGALAAAGEVAVCHVDLPMADECTPAACDALHTAGFFFAAVLPEYLDGDVLRVQRTFTKSASTPDLVTAEANEWLAAIQADRARATR